MRKSALKRDDGYLEKPLRGRPSTRSCRWPFDVATWSGVGQADMVRRLPVLAELKHLDKIEDCAADLQLTR